MDNKSQELLVNLKSSYGSDIDDILRQISTVCKMISNKIKRAGFDQSYGSTSITNFHGEDVKTLDVISNRLMINHLSDCRSIKSLISEEDVYEIPVNEDGKYIVCFDPLDGSSNIDVNVNIGTIFGIYETSDHVPNGEDLFISGYCLYGPATVFVLCLDNKVSIYTLDDSIGEFVLSTNNVKPLSKKIYSVNEGNFNLWDDETKDYIIKLKNEKYSLRYVGSMVADVHRTLIYGGIFMYPSSTNALNGKLRYLYEVAPMSHIVKTVNGKALINNEDALTYEPSTIHARVPIVLSIGQN